MIIKVKRSEENAIRFACATHGIRVYFYTDEKVPELCIIDLDVDLEKEPSILWYLSAEVQIKLQMEEEETASKKKLDELYKGTHGNLFDNFRNLSL